MMKRILSLAAAFFLLALIQGCRDSTDHTHGGVDDGHVHADAEEQTAVITVWTDRYEVFAEHAYVVAGKPTEFITHVTNRKTLEPRREGPIRFVMRQQGATQALEHRQVKPASDGLYLPRITFPEVGTWEVSIYIPNDDGELEVRLPDTVVYADEHDVEHAPPSEEHEGIAFLKEQQWKIQMATELVATRSVTERLVLTAMVRAKPGSMAEIASPLSGRFQPPASFPLMGDVVRAGQVLGHIHPVFSELGVKLVEAEANLVRSKHALEQAKQNFTRVQRLAETRAKSTRDLQEAEFLLKSAEANHQAAQALQSTYRQDDDSSKEPTVQITSPIAGTIASQATIATGEYIVADRVLFSIVNTDRVFIEAAVPETSIHRLKANKSASYQLPGESNQFHPITIAGRLVTIGLTVDPRTRAVPVIYEVPNSERQLRIGQAVTLSIETDRVESGLAILQSAIVEDEGQFVAFVQVAGETFERRDLELGIRDSTWVQVVSGLREGEQVVTQGAYAVRLASVSSAIPAHGHVH